VSRLWLELGPIDLLAGPDLAASVVTLDKLTSWLRGSLGTRFIARREDLDRFALAEGDRRTRDGAYGVREFSCVESGWKETIFHLSRSADAILMDLRSFTANNTGCAFEIQALMQAGLGERAVFLVDASTDVPALQRCLNAALRDECASTTSLPRLFELNEDTAKISRRVVGMVILASRAQCPVSARREQRFA
jgi:hypothetical protein